MLRSLAGEHLAAARRRPRRRSPGSRARPPRPAGCVLITASSPLRCLELQRQRPRRGARWPSSPRRVRAKLGEAVSVGGGEAAVAAVDVGVEEAEPLAACARAVRRCSCAARAPATALGTVSQLRLAGAAGLVEPGRRSPRAGRWPSRAAAAGSRRRADRRRPRARAARAGRRTARRLRPPAARDPGLAAPDRVKGAARSSASAHRSPSPRQPCRPIIRHARRSPRRG